MTDKSFESPLNADNDMMRSSHFCNNLAAVFTFICLFQVNVAKNLAPPLVESPKSEEALLLRNPVEDFLRERLEDFRIHLPSGD